MLPKMSEYRKDFDDTKYMSFLIKNEELLEKYYEIWDKVRNNIKSGFDSEPVYNEKHLKTEIKFYEGKINTNFYGDNVPKKGCQCIFLSIILIDSVFGTGKTYYPQVFLEECKCIVKEKKMPKYITDDLEISSDEENSYEENYSEKSSIEEDYIEEKGHFRKKVL